MNFDKYIRDMAASEDRPVPELVSAAVEKSLASLPEISQEKSGIHLLPRFSPRLVAACLVLTALFVMPNVSPAYAQVLEKLPVIGPVVNVITLRNYIHDGDGREMELSMPEIQAEDSAAQEINAEITALIEDIRRNFMEELEAMGYFGVNASYDTVTDSSDWFTIRLSVSETEASGYNYFRYYHIDKRTGLNICLEDLFPDERYKTALADDIIGQMRKRMAEDENAVFWIDGAMGEDDFTLVESQQNFYISDSGHLVIVFDEYQVGPGSMGSMEFEISPRLTDELVSPDYRHLFS